MNDEKMMEALKKEAKTMEMEGTPMLPGGRVKAMLLEVNRRKRIYKMRETAVFLGISVLLLFAEQALLRTASLLFILLQAGMIGIGIVLFIVLLLHQKQEVKQHE